VPTLGKNQRFEDSLPIPFPFCSANPLRPALMKYSGYVAVMCKPAAATPGIRPLSTVAIISP